MAAQIFWVQKWQQALTAKNCLGFANAKPKQSVVSLAGLVFPVQ